MEVNLSEKNREKNPVKREFQINSEYLFYSVTQCFIRRREFTLLQAGLELICVAWVVLRLGILLSHSPKQLDMCHCVNLLLFFNTGLSSSPDFPGTPYIDQVCLEFTEIHLPLPFKAVCPVTWVSFYLMEDSLTWAAGCWGLLGTWDRGWVKKFLSLVTESGSCYASTWRIIILLTQAAESED